MPEEKQAVPWWQRPNSAWEWTQAPEIQRLDSSFTPANSEFAPLGIPDSLGTLMKTIVNLIPGFVNAAPNVAFSTGGALLGRPLGPTGMARGALGGSLLAETLRDYGVFPAPVFGPKRTGMEKALSVAADMAVPMAGLGAYATVKGLNKLGHKWALSNANRILTSGVHPSLQERTLLEDTTAETNVQDLLKRLAAEGSQAPAPLVSSMTGDMLPAMEARYFEEGAGIKPWAAKIFGIGPRQPGLNKITEINNAGRKYSKQLLDDIMQREDLSLADTGKFGTEENPIGIGATISQTRKDIKAIDEGLMDFRKSIMREHLEKTPPAIVERHYPTTDGMLEKGKTKVRGPIDLQTAPRAAWEAMEELSHGTVRGTKAFAPDEKLLPLTVKADLENPGRKLLRDTVKELIYGTPISGNVPVKEMQIVDGVPTEVVVFKPKTVVEGGYKNVEAGKPMISPISEVNRMYTSLGTRIRELPPEQKYMEPALIRVKEALEEDIKRSLPPNLAASWEATVRKQGELYAVKGSKFGKQLGPAPNAAGGGAKPLEVILPDSISTIDDIAQVRKLGGLAPIQAEKTWQRLYIQDQVNKAFKGGDFNIDALSNGFSETRDVFSALPSGQRYAINELVAYANKFKPIYPSTGSGAIATTGQQATSGEAAIAQGVGGGGVMKIPFLRAVLWGTKKRLIGPLISDMITDDATRKAVMAGMTKVPDSVAFNKAVRTVKFHLKTHLATVGTKEYIVNKNDEFEDNPKFKGSPDSRNRPESITVTFY